MWNTLGPEQTYHNSTYHNSYSSRSCKLLSAEQSPVSGKSSERYCLYKRCRLAILYCTSGQLLFTYTYALSNQGDERGGLREVVLVRIPREVPSSHRTEIRRNPDRVIYRLEENGGIIPCRYPDRGNRYSGTRYNNALSAMVWDSRFGFAF